MPRWGVGPLVALVPLPGAELEPPGKLPEVPEVPLALPAWLPVPLEVEPPVELFEPPVVELPFEPPGRLVARPELAVAPPVEPPVEFPEVLLPEGLELVPPGRLPPILPFASAPVGLPFASVPDWPLAALLPGVPPLEVVDEPDWAESMPPFWLEPGVREIGVKAPAVMVPDKTELPPSPPAKLPERPALAFAVAVAWVLETVLLLPNALVSIAPIRTSNKTRKKRRTV